MINLLPQKEKQELLFQKNNNLVIVLCSMATIFLICLALILLSLKFYILQSVRLQKGILEETQAEYQTRDYILLLDSLKKYNSDLSKVDSFYKKEIHLSDLLKTILLIERPRGITFNSIALEETNPDNLPASATPNALQAGKIQANIYGISNTRDELILFKNNVENQQGIKNIYLPPDSLVKPSNVSFRLTFEVYPVK